MARNTLDEIRDARTIINAVNRGINAAVRADAAPQPEPGQPGYAQWYARSSAVQAIYAQLAAVIDQCAAYVDLDQALR
jgi:hypothetical protein